jgi:O-antigen/teichoic acid export membrane protein
VQFALGVAKTIVLARLIPLEYFGLLAGATVWTSYLSLGRLDLGLAVLRSGEESEVLTTQFLLENASTILGVALGAALAAVWPDLLPSTAWAMVFTLLAGAQVEALTSTSVYLAQRRLRQDLLGRMSVVAGLLGFAIPILLAWSGAPLAALLVNVLLPTLLPRLGAALLVRWRPRPTGDWAEMRAQLRLGWTMWSTGLLGKVAWELDNWLVFNVHRPGPVLWRAAGIEPAALYARAFNIGKMPVDVAAGAIGTSALALYAEGAARGSERLANIHRHLTWLLAWIAFAAGTFLFTAANDLARLLGPGWEPMAPLLRLLALFAVGRPLLQNGLQLLMARHEERAARAIMGLQALIMLTAGPPAVYGFGAAGAAVVASAMTVVAVVATERRVDRNLGCAGWRLYARPAFAAGVAAAVTLGLEPVLPGNPWLAAPARGGVTVLCFAAVLGMLDRPAARGAWRTVRRGLARA